MICIWDNPNFSVFVQVRWGDHWKGEAKVNKLLYFERNPTSLDYIPSLKPKIKNTYTNKSEYNP